MNKTNFARALEWTGGVGMGGTTLAAAWKLARNKYYHKKYSEQKQLWGSGTTQSLPDADNTNAGDSVNSGRHV